MSSTILSASILSADFAHLADDVNAILAAGVDYIHFDVMDHHYVPNLTFGSVVCDSLRKAGITAPIDVHLMVKTPQLYIRPFSKAGANLITFHPDTVGDVAQCIADIKGHDLKVGLALNPDQPLDMVADFLNQIDLLLLMSVFPGFSGQEFIVETFEKISAAKQLIQATGRFIHLAVDGGINISNIAKVVAAGANFCVLGTGLFAAESYEQRVADVKSEICQAVIE